MVRQEVAVIVYPIATDLLRGALPPAESGGSAGSCIPISKANHKAAWRVNEDCAGTHFANEDRGDGGGLCAIEAVDDEEGPAIIG